MQSTLDRLRTVAVVAVAGIAVTHLFELPDKFEESGVRYQGVLFIALIAGCLALALLARRLPSGTWWAGVLAVSALPLLAYVISRTVKDLPDTVRAQVTALSVGGGRLLRGDAGDNSNTQFAVMALWAGRRYGVPTPENETIWALVKGVEASWQQ